MQDKSSAFILFLNPKLHFVGPMRGPVVMESKAVVLGDAATGCKLEGVSAVVDPEAELDGLAGFHAPLHLRHFCPRYGALDHVVLYHQLRLPFDWSAVDCRSWLTREEMLAHHAGTLQTKDFGTTAVLLSDLV